MRDGIGPLGEAFLAASQLRESFEDMSAQEINKLPMADYAKIRERAGLPAADPFSEIYSATPPGREWPQEPAQALPAAPAPPDFSQIGMAEYAEIRSKFIRPSSSTGRGIFD